MSEEKKSFKHTVVMDNREEMSMTGITDVISFDEEMIAADTEMGVIVIKGQNLHVNRLNLEKGELEIDGDVISIVYEDSNTYGKPGGSFFGKIFK